MEESIHRNEGVNASKFLNSVEQRRQLQAPNSVNNIYLGQKKKGGGKAT